MGKKHKIQKTNVARLLDQAKVPYTLVPYEVDEKDLSAIHVAESLGENIAQVFKTIVLHGDKTGFFVCVLPGDKEINLKFAAKFSGNKKCELLPMKQLLPTTGYVRGGCCPIGMKKDYPIYFHSTFIKYPFVFVSAGIRGLQLQLFSPCDFVRICKGELSPLI